MFVSSHEVSVFDQFRVPYEISRDRGRTAAQGWATLVPRAVADRSIRWPTFDGTDGGGADGGAAPRRFRLGALLLHGHVLSDAQVRRSLPGNGKQWYPAEALTDGAEPLGSVWRSEAGDLLLPFDPNEIVTNFLTEGYRRTAASTFTLRSMAVSGYYLVRPLLPRPVQISARRLYSRVQARTAFPRWPVEPSLHQFYERVLGWAAEVAGEPVPAIAAWPSGHGWALVLTHDVETRDGLRLLPVLRGVESAMGFRSSWNMVPRRYAVPDDTVAALTADGFEVGLHGLYHDGRDLADGVFDRRLPEMRQWAKRWQARGFRSPATHRAWDKMAALPVEYDSSYPDTDPFEPQPGGCCSWLPYFNRSLVELPITLPQDHTLFVILRQRDARIWIDKAERIRAAGGMALVLTHPDYLDRAPVAEAYHQLLTRFADDRSVWRALPSEVARWWRRRNESSLERTGDGWRVVGPASEDATVALTPRGVTADTAPHTRPVLQGGLTEC